MLFGDRGPVENLHKDGRGEHSALVFSRPIDRSGAVATAGNGGALLSEARQCLFKRTTFFGEDTQCEANDFFCL